MSVRHVTKTVVASVAALSAAGALTLFGTTSLAGAAPPTSGSQVPGAAAPVAPFTPSTPFSSGQGINVVVPANSVFSPTTGLNVVECTAPGDVIPTDPAACDGNTINGPSLFSNSDGSVNYQGFTGSLYNVYALPDAISLGETPGGPVCSSTVPCVLYVGYNQGDFTQPHVWSQFFFVQANATDQGTNPGDGSPPPTPTTTTTLVAAPTSSVFGQSVSLTASVATNVPATCTPSGLVTFSNGPTNLGSAAVSGGHAAISTATLPVGTDSLTASFAGNTGCPASASAATSFVVSQASTTTSLTAVPAGGSSNGQSVTFTATVAPVSPGAGSPSGTVTFKDGTTAIGTGTLSGGTATLTTSSLSTGSHNLTASYGGSTNFAASSGALTYSVGLASTTTSVVAAPTSSVSGQSVTLTATVAPVAPATAIPTGTVTFKDGTTTIGTAQTLSPTGTASVSTSSLAVASHSITATYGGDASNNGSSGMTTLVVSKASTTTSLVAAPASSSVFGQSVTFTATVAPVAPGAGSPTGSVTFTDGATTLGTSGLSGNTASISTSSLAVGSHSIVATYSGDTDFATGASSAGTYAVNPASTKSTLTSSANPSTPTESVTFTDTVAAVAPGAGTPTGSVTFEDGSTAIGTGTLSGGVATLTTSTLSNGTHPISAVYAAAGSFSGSTSNTVNQVVAQFTTTTVLTSSVNPSVPGQSVTFTATVSASSGAATGTVTFNDGSTAIGTGTIGTGGVATLTTSTLALGTHPITAVYGGTAAVGGSTSNTVNQVVALLSSTTTLTSSANPSAPGQAVTFTATVTSTGTPTGTVTFSDGSTGLGTGTLAAGKATLTTSTLALGTHPITAVYGGSSTITGSTSNTVNQVVANIATTTVVTSSANPSGPGQAVTFTATVTAASGATPAGTVTFRDGTTVLGTGTLNAASQATLTTSALAIGTHPITATYAGAGSDLGSTSATLNQVVTRLPTTLVATAQIVLLPYSSIIPAVQTKLTTVGGLPVTGVTITFTAAGQLLCQALTNAAGVATCTPTGAGELYVLLSDGYTATFLGTTVYQPSTGAANAIVL